MGEAALKLDAETMYGFQGSMLSARYDEPKPTPAFHMELWEIACRDDPFVAIAAPRHHAKTTAITLAYGLANALFELKSNIMILSDTQEQAEQFLYYMKIELQENQALRDYFKVGAFIRERDHEIIVQIGDSNRKFRIFAKGTGQSLRGALWLGKRPDLIICDDMENDEMVMNRDRRSKLRKWFLSTLIPILSDSGQIRMVGTILHQDGLLETLLNSRLWTTRRYEAHNDDFSFILWPEKWPEAKLRMRMDMYREQNEYEIYLQEFRNIPIDDTIALFRHADFLPITEKPQFLEYYIGVDCAVSERTTADWTVFCVVGVDKDGKLYVVNVIRERMGPLESVDTFFELHRHYHPQCFIVEDENISKAIGPFIYEQMPKRNLWPEIQTLGHENKDLTRRSSSIRARMRAGGVEFDHDAEWFEDFRAELKMFPRGKHDDQVSAIALVGMWLHRIAEADEKLADFTDDDQLFGEVDEMFEGWEEDDYYDDGRNSDTGY